MSSATSSESLLAGINVPSMMESLGSASLCAVVGCGLSRVQSRHPAFPCPRHGGPLSRCACCSPFRPFPTAFKDFVLWNQLLDHPVSRTFKKRFVCSSHIYTENTFQRNPVSVPIFNIPKPWAERMEICAKAGIQMDEEPLLKERDDRDNCFNGKRTEANPELSSHLGTADKCLSAYMSANGKSVRLPPEHVFCGECRKNKLRTNKLTSDNFALKAEIKRTLSRLTYIADMAVVSKRTKSNVFKYP